jgi:hypothetical protein
MVFHGRLNITPIDCHLSPTPLCLTKSGSGVSGVHWSQPLQRPTNKPNPSVQFESCPLADGDTPSILQHSLSAADIFLHPFLSSCILCDFCE